MTDAPHQPDHRDGLPPEASRAVALSGLALVWEGLWPRLALLLSIAGAFLALAWLGAFERLPAVLRLTAASLFAVALLFALVHLLRTPRPNRRPAPAGRDRHGHRRPGIGGRRRAAAPAADTAIPGWWSSSVRPR